VAVTLDTEEYRDILEQLEDLEDIKMLDDMRKKPLAFRRLEDFLRQSQHRVIYKVDDQEKPVSVMRVRHRREVYCQGRTTPFPFAASGPMQVGV